MLPSINRAANINASVAPAKAALATAVASAPPEVPGSPAEWIDRNLVTSVITSPHDKLFGGQKQVTAEYEAGAGHSAQRAEKFGDYGWETTGTDHAVGGWHRRLTSEADLTPGNLFQKVGNDFQKAIDAARDEVAFNRYDLPDTEGNPLPGAAGVLQGKGGAYYITMLDHGDSGSPLTTAVARSQKLDLYPLTADLKAVVGASELFNFTDLPAKFEPLDGAVRPRYAPGEDGGGID
ncbi:MAG: hypothetical protein JWO69_763 [Thermoleophilia bacterium]|jgi:hypothetical protein|nr:hypothetical protein [Thermoleophilia bacterium]